MAGLQCVVSGYAPKAVRGLYFWTGLADDTPMNTDLNTLRQIATTLTNERDLRFFDGNDIMRVLANQTAGERMRKLSNPLLDEAGAAALRDATLTYAIPAMDERDLVHLIHCLKFCPKLTTPAAA